MWETLLKNTNLVAPSSKTSGKWNLNTKPIPQREEVEPVPEPEPKTTCVEEFNKIVDWVLGEINRTEARSAPLWNTQTDKGPNELTSYDIGHKNHFMTWTYYYRNSDEYHNEDYYKHTLINSEHICWHAENEEAACQNLKGLSRASVSVDRELRETAQDDFIQLEYGMRLNSFDASDLDMFVSFEILDDA